MQSESHNNQNPICNLSFELKRSICAQVFADPEFQEKKSHISFNYNFNKEKLEVTSTLTIDYKASELGCVPINLILQNMTDPKSEEPAVLEYGIPCPALHQNSRVRTQLSDKNEAEFIIRGGENLIFGVSVTLKQNDGIFRGTLSFYVRNIDIENLITSKKDKKEKKDKKDKKKKKKDEDEDEGEEEGKDKKSDKKKKKDEEEKEDEDENKEKKKEKKSKDKDVDEDKKKEKKKQKDDEETTKEKEEEKEEVKVKVLEEDKKENDE